MTKSHCYDHLLNWRYQIPCCVSTSNQICFSWI